MKLFNKKRYQLFKGNRFQKYIAYAIGEIILVIVGILIALGISNWRQNKLLANANINLQNKVLVQMNKDIASLEVFQEELSVLHETYMKALGRDYDREKVDLGGVVATVLFDVKTLSLDQQVINLIDNAQLDDSETSQDLVELASIYKIYAKDIEDIEDIIYSKFTSNLEVIEKTQPWYSELMTDFKCCNECIQFILHDEGQKARIASLRFLYINGYGQIIDGFQNDLKIAKDQLQKSMINEKR